MTLLSQAIAWRRAFGRPMLNELLESGSINEAFDIVDLQEDLITEEANEAVDASFDLWNEAEDADDLRQHLNSDKGRQAKVALLKELADTVFVAYGYAAFMGMDLDTAMNRVFESNMSKVDDNGNPILNNAGKVLKGPNYKPPILDDLV